MRPFWGSVVILGLDDTLARKRGLKMFGTLNLLCEYRKNQRFHVIADSASGGQSVLCHLPPNCDLTSRLLKDARSYAAPPKRKPGTNGRPRKRGERLPTPREMLAGRGRRVTLAIYGHREQVCVADQVAQVHVTPTRPLRVVAVEAIQGGSGQEVFYSTCSNATAEQVIGWYAMRWSIEVMYHDSKQHLGFEEPQGWTRRSVERTAPAALLLYSLIVLWLAREGHRRWHPLECPWYTSKTEPSFADMLATLRQLSIRQQVFSLALAGPRSRKIQQLLENTVALAT